MNDMELDWFAYVPLGTGLRLAQTTYAPWAAYRTAMARPIPVDAPVTMATLSSRRVPIEGAMVGFLLDAIADRTERVGMCV